MKFRLFPSFALPAHIAFTSLPLAALSLCLTPCAHADFVQTGAGPYDYNDTANWASTTIDGTWASGLTLTAAQRATFAADTVLTTDLAFG
jgi:hypothetical protein